MVKVFPGKRKCTHMSPSTDKGAYYIQSYDCTKKIDKLIFSTVVTCRSMGEGILTAAEMTHKGDAWVRSPTNICENFNPASPCTSYRQLQKSLHSPTSQPPAQAFLSSSWHCKTFKLTRGLLAVSQEHPLPSGENVLGGNYHMQNKIPKEIHKACMTQEPP